ncbi:MAG: MFS transporter [Pseudomonadales bacterium]
MPPSAKSQYIWYMTGIVTWVVPLGIQMILFTWLIAVQLQESAERLGIAQMMMQLPGLFLILVGGLLADKVDPRRILAVVHLLATLPALALAALLYTDQLAYGWLLLYALAMGTAHAFIVPARDGMLNRVAANNLQQGVTVVMGLTFGAQLIGFIAASNADSIGGIPLLLLQAGIILLGVIAALKLTPVAVYKVMDTGGRFSQLTRGFSVVWGSRAMRPAVAMLAVMSFFYGGTFIVLNPLMVRDIYGGAAYEISLSYGCFVIGTVTATILMVLAGGLKRQGRALLLAILTGAAILAMTQLHLPLVGYLAIIFLWGAGGGVAMSMGRTIMQETAPNELRSRVMAVFTLANTGGMPFGALTLGLCAEHLGVLNALLIVVIGAATMTLAIWWLSDLANLRVGGVQADDGDVLS